MDDFLQTFFALSPVALVIPFIGLLISYLVIRLAVMHALRDHERWVEKRRKNAARSTHSEPQAYPPITPGS